MDLGETKTIHSVVTQGRNKYAEWTKTYKVEVGNTTSSMSFITNEDGSIKVIYPMSDNKNIHRIHLYFQIFQGNSDNTNMAFASFEPPIDAKYFRIYPLTYSSYPDLRFDLLDC